MKSVVACCESYNCLCVSLSLAITRNPDPNYIRMFKLKYFLLPFRGPIINIRNGTLRRMGKRFEQSPGRTWTVPREGSKPEHYLKYT